MLFNTAYLNARKSRRVEDYLKKRIGNTLGKMSDCPVALELTFDKERLDHVVHLRYVSEKGESINLVQKELDVYSAIDGLAKRFGRKLSKTKGKRMNMNRRQKPEPLELELN